MPIKSDARTVGAKFHQPQAISTWSIRSSAANVTMHRKPPSRTNPMPNFYRDRVTPQEKYDMDQTELPTEAEWVLDATPGSVVYNLMAPSRHMLAYIQLRPDYCDRGH